MARRGPYAKGVAKREEILERALDVIAREGFRHTSVKGLAEAVGLSQAGLLHYFGTKEELYAEVLRKRDQLDAEAMGDVSRSIEDFREQYIDLIRRNQGVPGLVRLFAAMSVDGTDDAHPAHRFLAERGPYLRGLIAAALTDRLDPRVSPEIAARLLQAVSDGLQLQWMLDPDVDMAEITSVLLELLLESDDPGPEDDRGRQTARDRQAARG